MTDTHYLTFCPRLKTMIETGTTLDRNGEPVQIAGVSTLNNLRVIRELILRKRMSRTLEVGLAYGGSALVCLSTLKECAVGDFHHTSIDPFENSHWRGCALRAIEEEGYGANFTHEEGFSGLVLPDLVRRKAQFDLIYIDGSHLFEDVFIDFFYSVQLLSTGGIVLFDDCTDKHVKKVIRFVRGNYSSILEEVDLGPYEDPDKPLKKRIGNRLGIRQLVGFRKTGEPPRPWDAEFRNF
jgi:predicted O-methyltransferase YrrM